MMRKTICTLWAAAMLMGILAVPGNAALVGSSVNGSLTFDGDPSNYFDPGYGFVPATGYLNTSGTTVTVSSSAVEFGFDDGSSLISANFSDSQLIITDLIETSGPTNSFRMIFTDSAFSLQSLLRVSDSFPLSDYSITGNVISLGYAGSTPNAGQTLTATFDFINSPEPASLGLISVSAIAILALYLIRGGQGVSFQRPSKKPLRTSTYLSGSS